MKTFAQIILIGVAIGVLAGCQTSLQKETPIGHACYRQFSYDYQPRYYGCLFELSAPSAFYDDREVRKILEHFKRNEGGQCVEMPETEVVDAREKDIDHGLGYRLFVIRCQ